VANACSPDSINSYCKYIHKMEPLKLEDSKKLFISRVFGSTDASYPKEFEYVMGDILKKCGGLPLAIISITSVLVGYKSPGRGHRARVQAAPSLRDAAAGKGKSRCRRWT
jgi:disease resistance protein RPM1